MPALVSVYLISIWSDPRPNLKIFFYSLGALIFSISTKFASVLLVPIWITTLSWPFPTSDRLRQQINNELAKLSVQLGMKLTWSTFWPLISSFMMFLPLVLTRSQQFNPWYFIWILVWLPLIKLDWWRQTILAFSVSSLLRYLPWLMTGGYSPVVLTNQKQITWLIPLVWLLIYRGYQQYQYNKLNH